MSSPEFWLRGPVAGIPPVLQPVAHALLQARQEVNALMEGFPAELLWERPAGVASIGFHLQHLRGILDRLFTYAHGKPLTRMQLVELKAEGQPGRETAAVLMDRFNAQVDKALRQLGEISEAGLTAGRPVGRAQLPSTVIGLLFHAAEHSMRHTGQLLVTVKVLKAAENVGNRRDQ
ncbi:MAG TPA: DinB family protein [Puia sp.]|nr:DinB family protein [Puia sp.]